MKSLNKRIIATIILAIVLATAGIAIYMSQKKTIIWPKNDTQKKVVILGFDGTEHTLLDQWVKEGKLPNIAKLINTGTYSSLETATPAQSPVAWSSFATGTNPGKHDVMEFLSRNPKTYMPEPGMLNVDSSGIGIPKVTNRQQGQTFWDILSQNGVKSKIIKVPATFPAEPLDGELLTGLGTPDAMGTMGTFSYYTTTNASYKDNDKAYNLYNLENNGELITKVQGLKTSSEKLTIKRNSDSVDMIIGKQKINIKVDSWSDYIDFDFNLVGPFFTEHGIGKFYLEESSPDLKLYLSPISFDPEKPFFKISYPDDYSGTLAKENGKFKTTFFCCDVWALKEERISEAVFLEDLNNTMDEEIRIMKSEMAKNDWNVYTQVFQETDLVQHMFWRYIEPKNPRYEDDPRYKDAILNVYMRMDQMIGDVQKTLSQDTSLIVMSDHGFAPYNYSVDLNAWLVDNGYMTLKDPSKRGDWMNMNVQDPKFWDNVDWSKTKAYGLGLGSLYINLKGREGQGIVTDTEYPTLRNEIRDRLLTLENEGEKVFSNIYKREDVMHGPYLGGAADLIMGFAKGYRVSWQTTYGAVPKQVIFPNDSKFSAEHCSVDPKLVPGLFISNRKFGDEAKSIMDIAPTILNIFGISSPTNMDGKVLN